MLEEYLNLSSWQLRGGGGGGGGGIGYQVADTGPVGWVNFWPGCSLVPKY